MKNFRRIAFSLSLISTAAWVACATPSAQSSRSGAEVKPQWSELASEMDQAITAIDKLRETVAATLKDKESSKITPADFQNTCMVVGKAIKSLAAEKKWEIRQVSAKYRNPSNKPTEREFAVLREFEQDPSKAKIIREEKNASGLPGVALYRRITVEASCLKCHGAKESRPGFIKVKYPQDLAYDFKVGDLRGMYRVFGP